MCRSRVPDRRRRRRVSALTAALLLLMGGAAALAPAARAQTPRRVVETVPARPIGEPARPSASGPASGPAPAAALPSRGSAVVDRGSRPKLAVLVLKTDDVSDELADNLTEVLIAALARRPESFEFVGKEEFKSRLALAGSQAQRCLDDVTCLGRVGVTLGSSQIIAGTVGRRGPDHIYNLNLIDLSTGKLIARVYNLVGGGVPQLIGSVQSAADKLFERARPAGAVRVAGAARGAQIYLDDEFIGIGPARRENLEPGKHQLRVIKSGRHGWQKEIEIPSGAQLDISVAEGNLPRRRRWPKVLAWSALGVAGGAGVAGLLLGILSQESPPSGLGRQATLDFRQSRANQALIANVLFGVAGGAALTSGLTFTLAWKEIAGDDETPSMPRPAGSRAEQPRRRVPLLRAGLSPAPGGALLVGGVPW